MQNKKEIFEIDPNKHKGRWNYLYKEIIGYVKLYQQRHLKRKQGLPPGLKLYFSLKDEISIDMEKMIGAAIIELLCYEAKDAHKELCEKISKDKSNPEYMHLYKLDEATELVMKKEIDNFIDVYTNPVRDEDLNNETFDYVQTSLSNTLEQASADINSLKEYAFKGCHTCADIHHEYSKLIQVASSLNTKKTTAIAKALKDANMNQLIEKEGKYVYPFLYDLLLMSFSLRMCVAENHDSITETSALADTVWDIDASFVQKDTESYYLYKELIRLIKEIPPEARELKNFLENLEESNESLNDLQYIHPTTLLLIKHYAEILNVECKKILSVFHLMGFKENNEHKKRRTENSCTEKIEKIPLSFHQDTLREKSLYVI